MQWTSATGCLEILQGDLTLFKADAVVNAANSRLAGGGGVDGALHAAAGPALLADCSRWVARHGLLPAGKAMVTPAHRLPARHVIHTVGPVWRGGKNNEETTLRQAYESCFTLCRSNGFAHVAFPAISCGTYGYPASPAARVALACAAQALACQGAPAKITFVLHTAQMYTIWLKAAQDAAPDL
jgi:O-acetyl-ADP-ribose deacetylase (regulator of RNase III)